MKTITKIIIAIGILFLIMGTVSAFEVKDLKTVKDYTDWDGFYWILVKPIFKTNDYIYYSLMIKY